MLNLDQIRATNALRESAHVDKQAVNKLPAMIVNNGLLAAAAFAHAKGDTLCQAMNAIVNHLRDPKIARLQSANAETAIAELSKGSSDKLRLATAEALAFLSFLKRFAKREK